MVNLNFGGGCSIVLSLRRNSRLLFIRLIICLLIIFLLQSFNLGGFLISIIIVFFLFFLIKYPRGLFAYFSLFWDGVNAYASNGRLLRIFHTRAWPRIPWSLHHRWFLEMLTQLYLVMRTIISDGMHLLSMNISGMATSSHSRRAHFYINSPMILTVAQVVFWKGVHSILVSSIRSIACSLWHAGSWILYTYGYCTYISLEVTFVIVMWSDSGGRLIVRSTTHMIGSRSDAFWCFWSNPR